MFKIGTYDIVMIVGMKFQKLLKRTEGIFKQHECNELVEIKRQEITLKVYADNF